MKFKTLLFLIIFIILIPMISNIYWPSEDNLPALVFVYDDGHQEDIELALPVHQKYEVPAVSAVNSSTIGNVNFLDKQDLLRLQNNGWEIASHGKYHTALIYYSLKEGLNKCDQKITINNSNIIEPRYSYYIYDYIQKHGEVINFKKRLKTEGDAYFKLADELEHQYNKDSSYIMLTKKAMKKEIVESKKKLTAMGLDVNNFVYPYNGYTDPARSLVKDHYIFARGGPQNGQAFLDRFINYFPLQQYNLKGISFENNEIDRQELAEILKTGAKEKSLLIFYAHTGNQNFSTERLEYIIKTAQKLKYNITTFNELMRK
ncbi:MAG TPA: polysaccharide deacetylase family protein [Halanaerobiales bacterium]|nr:polysaccharide deacetylase family protein [Halanaerobiales bacterium]